MQAMSDSGLVPAWAVTSLASHAENEVFAFVLIVRTKHMLDPSVVAFQAAYAKIS